MTDRVFDSEGVEVINTAQSVFPNAVVKSRRGPLPVIIVDQQEKLPLSRYFDPAKVQVETAHLETGDYSLKGGTDLLCIERKSLADLLECCTNDRERFMDQLRRMQNYPSRFLVIEAKRELIEAEVYSKRVGSASVINAVLGASVRWNICVEYRDGPADTARMVQWIVLKVAQLQKEGFYENRVTG